MLKSDLSTHSSLGTHKFQKFSSCKRSVKALALLKRVASSRHSEFNYKIDQPFPFKGKSVQPSRKLGSSSSEPSSKNSLRKSCSVFIKRNHYPEIASSCPLIPSMTRKAFMRVGGHLNKAEISSNQINPVILLAGHHISALLVQHHHSLVKQQGRHFTAGAVRAAGLWIIGGKRLISSVFHKCVKCRRLRGGHVSTNGGLAC